MKTQSKSLCRTCGDPVPDNFNLCNHCWLIKLGLEHVESRPDPTELRMKDKAIVVSILAGLITLLVALAAWRAY